MIHCLDVQGIPNHKNKSLPAVRTVMIDSAINDWNIGSNSEIRAEWTDIACPTGALKDECMFTQYNHIDMRIQLGARIS